MDTLKILDHAIELESDGHAFYQEAADHSPDPPTAELFRSLAQEEQNHLRYLSRQQDALKAGEQWQAIPEIEPSPRQCAERPVYPAGADVLESLPELGTDEDVLLFAIGVEITSYDLYADCGRLADNDTARGLFAWLANAEREHFDLLMQRLSARFAYPR